MNTPKRVANRSPSFLRFVEVLWKSGLHEAQKRPRIGSPKIGSFYDRIIISKIPAPANTKREVLRGFFLIIYESFTRLKK